MLLTFLTEYVPKDIDGTGKEAKPVRELGKIAKNYVYGDFLSDIIPLVPLQLISIKARLNNLFYLIKVIRFVKGKELFNIMELMKNVKEYNKEKLMNLDEHIANDPTIDNNNMKQVMFISLALRTVRLILMIFNFAYFIGMGWLVILSTISRIYHYEATVKENFLRDPEQEYFVEKYDMHLLQNSEIVIVGVYFAFTSLSTVGFGDFVPWSNFERILGSQMILFGVMIFSYCMSKFIEMMTTVLEFNSTLEDGDSLSKFFGVCEKFNHNQPFNLELKRKIEAHLNYKWQNDKNQALC